MGLAELSDSTHGWAQELDGMRAGPGPGYAAAEAGIHKKQNLGQTWWELLLGLPRLACGTYWFV